MYSLMVNFEWWPWKQPLGNDEAIIKWTIYEKRNENIIPRISHDLIIYERSAARFAIEMVNM